MKPGYLTSNPKILTVIPLCNKTFYAIAVLTTFQFAFLFGNLFVHLSLNRNNAEHSWY